MSDSEKSLSDQIKLAVEAGAVAEVKALVSSDAGVRWTVERAKAAIHEVLDGKTVTAKEALHHALLIAFEAGNFLCYGLSASRCGSASWS